MTASRSLAPAAAVLTAALLAAGCGPKPKTVTEADNPTFGPHGGVAVALPEGGRFVEVAQEDEAGRIRLVAFFFDSPSLEAPIDPVPSGVSVRLDTPEGTPQEVSLEHQPRPNTPGGAARFVSSPGTYDFDPLAGTLRATVGGQPVEVRFSGGHY